MLFFFKGTIEKKQIIEGKKKNSREIKWNDRKEINEKYTIKIF